MTAKEYYDLLCQSAHDGTFPSIDRGRDKCLYRGPGGSKCAIGVLIEDDKYSSILEDTVTREVVTKAQVKIPEGLCFNDLCYLQNYHDSCARLSGGWDAEVFIDLINQRPCFDGCH